MCPTLFVFFFFELYKITSKYLDMNVCHFLSLSAVWCVCGPFGLELYSITLCTNNSLHFRFHDTISTEMAFALHHTNTPEPPANSDPSY